MKGGVCGLLVIMAAILVYTALSERGLGWALYSELAALLSFCALRFLLGLIRGSPDSEQKEQEGRRADLAEEGRDWGYRQDLPWADPQEERDDGPEEMEGCWDDDGAPDEDDSGADEEHYDREQSERAAASEALGDGASQN